MIFLTDRVSIVIYMKNLARSKKENVSISKIRKDTAFLVYYRYILENNPCVKCFLNFLGIRVYAY